MSNGCECATDFVVSLDQERCAPEDLANPIMMPVTVKDNLTNVFVSGARVSLILTNSLSGPSLIDVGTPMYTDSEGSASFLISMNGEYSVSVSADGYVSSEVDVAVECNSAHCEACAPTAPVALNQDFCRDKSLKLIVRDAQTNEPLVGATVATTIEFFNGPQEISSLTTGMDGVVLIPIVANGVYEATVSMNGYISYSTSYEIDVTNAECDTLAPVILMPLTATPEVGCLTLSLTWDEEPQDLDLYSYRVHENNTNDQCLTYYCDGKDPCDGVTFDVDNQEGGDSGTETITYCPGSEGYSNMVYVDDLSGEGRSLLSSSARIIITANDRQQEIVLNTTQTDDNANKRYWLAGCLVTDGAGEFEFMELNQFLDVQPSVEDPLVCHSRLALTEAQDNYGPELDATVIVTVYDAITDGPLEEVMLTFSNPRESHSRLTNVDGSASLPVRFTGEYTIKAEAANYVQEQQTMEINCNVGSETCVVQYEISLLPKPTDDSLQISLGWGQATSEIVVNRALATISSEQDLDLHVLQVDTLDTRVFCETYFGNPSGCSNTDLNHNIPDGGIRKEVVSVSDTTAQSGLNTYMIFVDDNSVAGPSIFETGARVTITDKFSTRVEDMPALSEDSVAGSKYWLVGCLELSGETYNFVPVNTFSRESPHSSQKYYCHNVFQNGGAVIETEPFCPNVEMKIAVHNVLTNADVPATASIIVKEGSNEFTVASGISLANSYITTPINRNGVYNIRLDSEGFVSTREEYTVSCDINDCRSCEATFLVPMSPTLNPGELRMVLGWGEKPRDLDIYLYRRNVNRWGTSCYTNYAKKSGCSESKLDLDNTRGGNNGVETITLHDTPSNIGNVYMVFVQHYGYNRVTDEFKNSKAQIRLTDGAQSSVVQLDSSSYGGEKHWVAGCVRLTEAGYDFSPVNMFLNNRPDSEVPDLCLDTFGLSTTTTTTTTAVPRTTTTRRPWWRRIFG